MSAPRNVVVVTQGSKEKVIVRLSDPETKERFDLTPFESGKAIFKTTNGETVEKIISFPVDTPKLGVVEFTLLSVDTQKFDRSMKGFELEFVYTGGPDKHVVPLKNSLEVEERL